VCLQQLCVCNNFVFGFVFLLFCCVPFFVLYFFGILAIYHQVVVAVGVVLGSDEVVVGVGVWIWCRGGDGEVMW
jgi:hypothetical protein